MDLISYNSKSIILLILFYFIFGLFIPGSVQKNIKAFTMQVNRVQFVNIKKTYGFSSIATRCKYVSMCNSVKKHLPFLCKIILQFCIDYVMA